MAFDGPVIVIGASAGGVNALREVVEGIPAGFEGAVFVVMHIAPSRPSLLADILGRSGHLPVASADDGAGITAGRIYVAPPDHHLLIEGAKIAVAKGPKENRFRPSIDALFRSAAYHYGPKVIGVVLSGALDDGTSGLWTIKRFGGTSVIQTPSDAQFDSMPLSALQHVPIDFNDSARDIGPLLSRLVGSQNEPHREIPEERLRKQVGMELQIAVEGGAFQKGIMELGEPTPYTCPECHGVLIKLKEGRIRRYRCHTGHGYSDSALIEGVMESSGAMLWQVMRSLEEAVMVMQSVGEDQLKDGNGQVAQAYLAKAKELENRSKQFHDMVLKHESLSGDNLERNR